MLRSLTVVSRTPIVRAPLGSCVRFNSSNAGREGPLTGKGSKNAGRKGPLTGGSKDTSASKSSSSAGSKSSDKSSSKKEESEDGSTKEPIKQSKAAERSDSGKGAEASSTPKSAPGQGMEDKGGHAVPQGPGKDGQFAEQGGSALKVAGAVDSPESEEGRDQKVDAKFWSDQKSDEKK